MIAGIPRRWEAPIKPGHRRWRWVLAIGLVGVGALAITLSLSAVQRRIAMWMFPAGPGTSLEFQDLHVGLRQLHVRGLRVDWHGLKVVVDEVDARYRVFGFLASRTARVDHLRVRGLVVDVRSIDRARPDSTSPAGDPFRFEGLLPFARLPFRTVLSDVDIDLVLLAPAPGDGTVRLQASLSGRDIAPGATGELDAEIGLRLERQTESRDVLAGTGSLRVHENEAGVFDLLQYHGEGRPADPSAMEGAGLQVQLSADLTGTDEAYRVVWSTTGVAARDVVTVDATRRASDGRVAGSWKAQLDAGQADPFLGDLVLPEFALTGTGTFEIDPATRTAATESRFEASASRWDRLDPALAAIGALRFDTEIAADIAGPSIEVRSLSARMAPAGSEAVLEIGADQPFRVDTAARTLEASRWGAPLAHLRLEDLPATWWGGSGTGVEAFAGTLRGTLELTADDQSSPCARRGRSPPPSAG